jgi:hypothetical protein
VYKEKQPYLLAWREILALGSCAPEVVYILLMTRIDNGQLALQKWRKLEYSRSALFAACEKGKTKEY